MAASPSKRRRRRKFLKQIPATIAAGLAVPSVLGPHVAVAQTPAPASVPQAGSLTAETLAAAQQVASVSLPAAELEAARQLVTRNVNNIALVRNVALPSDVEPAFSYRPPRPKTPSRLVGRPSRALPTPGPRIGAVDALAFEPVTMLAARLRARQVTSTELTTMYLERLKKYDETLFCVVTLTEALAREQAAQADAEIRAGRFRGPLHGIPYGIKDLFSAKGIPTTWGAKPYEKQVFDYDSTAVTRLREAGAVLIAKLSTGELAIGDLWFRARTRNPWNPERGANGSSAGPASAAAAGLVGFAVGTETNGSIISPSSTCGAVGLRPTYGRVSRYGCMTLRWTLDKVGAIARSVGDTSLVLDALHGPDGRDETVADLPFFWDGSRNVKGLRIGYVEREFDLPAAKPLADGVLDVYRKAGATLSPITLPELPSAAVYALLNAEAGAMFDELVRSGAINELADKTANGRANQLRAARFIPAVDYIRAQRVRTLLLQQVNQIFESVDVFLAPASSASVTMSNLTGHPAITVPAGFIEGLPVGLMVTGPLYKEERVLQAAAAFEAATEWRTKHPVL
jgi:Asp-tRNA(Asn)/Glu-tRNA(Gln) amidotransferase A subunit family amidase